MSRFRNLSSSDNKFSYFFLYVLFILIDFLQVPCQITEGEKMNSTGALNSGRSHDEQRHDVFDRKQVLKKRYDTLNNATRFQSSSNNTNKRIEEAQNRKKLTADVVDQNNRDRWHLRDQLAKRRNELNQRRCAQERVEVQLQHVKLFHDPVRLPRSAAAPPARSTIPEISPERYKGLVGRSKVMCWSANEEDDGYLKHSKPPVRWC